LGKWVIEEEMRDGEGWLGTHVVAELAHEGGKVVVVFFCFFYQVKALY